MLTIPAPPDARRFRALTRVSDEKLKSIPDQLADCAAYVERVGGFLDGLYNVGEQSGFSMTESHVYRAMLDDARRGAFHALVVRDTSRLGRDYWEKLGTLRDLRAAKIEFHVVEDGGRFDFEDRLAKVKNFASSWADEEKKKEEIRKAIRATDHVRESGFPTTMPPYGYRLVKDPAIGRRVWRPDPEEAAVVRAVFEGVVAGARLADLGRAHGLTYAQLDRMLKNPSYRGGYVWKGEFRACAPEIVPPLVDEALWGSAQARRRVR